MAAHLGAASCDLMDLNPRAVQFMHESVEMSGLDPLRCRVVEGDIASFVPVGPYDLICANPPFVPTPPTMAGVVHSNGGDDGCAVTRLLLEKLGELLRPAGRALIWSLQIESEAGPILAEDLSQSAPNRAVEMMETTDCHIDFDRLTGSLIATEPDAIAGILQWRDGLVAEHGESLTLNWYLIHIGPEDASKQELTVSSFDAERCGDAYSPRPLDHRRRIQRLVDLEIMR